MRDYLLRGWNSIDPFYYTCSRLDYVIKEKTEDNKSLFRVRLTRYQGHEVTLHDGTVIKKHDLLLKIHLHNVRMLTDLQALNQSKMKKALFIYYNVKRELPILAHYVKKHQHSHKIKGIIGITSLYKGANRLGFEAVPIRNVCYRTYKKLAFSPIYFIANTSSKDPVYLFMSKEALMNKYYSTI
ncbi:hypothetical protein [Oceanobacillus sp. CFH 90083]|uniref:YkoP family protein n=1 Tax=Oceanobacillus sp. CFH 90083 TaxID=2592336 RepID=UPI00128B8F89|nr:hypothetical protein [Oceanobacillus sp. CFH 90083]